MQLPYDLEIIVLGIYHRELNTENLFTNVYGNIIITSPKTVVIQMSFGR